VRLILISNCCITVQSKKSNSLSSGPTMGSLKVIASCTPSRTFQALAHTTKPRHRH